MTATGLAAATTPARAATTAFCADGSTPMAAVADVEAYPADKPDVRAVVSAFIDALKKLGLEEIESDCKFDPTKHEAVMKEKVDGKESGDIVVVFQKGYRMGDRVIRHCMVKVAE